MQKTQVRYPGQEDPREGNGNPLSILAWEIPWTEELVGFSPRGHKESDTTEAAEHAHSMSGIMGELRTQRLIRGVVPALVQRGTLSRLL